MDKRIRIAVVGGGLGGATVSALLQREGYQVAAFEQAPAFAPAGAGIHLSPNAMKVMRRIGVEADLVRAGCRPAAFCSRAWDSGELLFELPLGEAAEARYGSPYLTIHRGTFHRMLIGATRPGTIRYGMDLRHLERRADGVTLHFGNGRAEIADVVIGADGLSSRVREVLQGAERPLFSRQAAYRCIIPAADLKVRPSRDLTKWWASDRFVIAYYLDAGRDDFYFVAGFPCEEWSHLETSAAASRELMLDQFSDFHPEVRAILESATIARQWPLFERRPHSVWHEGRVVLLGDACHPMRPHMAQGASMAIEDAAVLTRCLQGAEDGDWRAAFQRYVDTRMRRTNRVQELSAANTWLRDSGSPDWVFAYDAGAVVLAGSEAPAAARA